LDLEQNKLQLIDFGLSGRPDPQHNKNTHYYFDIERMGNTVLPAIFPDILSRNNSDINIEESVTPVLKNAIKKLQEAMTNNTPNLRCNCDNALLYCQELLANYETLNDRLLENITLQTIYPKEKKTKNVLYEYSVSEGKPTGCSLM
jgi:hypothetical protein